MAATSKFIQISDYCLVEYIYSDLLEPQRYNFDVIKVVDNHLGALYNQIMNVDNAITATENVQTNSVVKITPGTYAALSDSINHSINPTPYLAYDPLFTVTTGGVGYPYRHSASLATAAENGGLGIPYDLVRFHFLSGFVFPNIDGVIFEIAMPERSGKNCIFADIAFLKSSTFFEYNPFPIWLGDRYYDRYVELAIPALKLINDDFYAASPLDQPATFVGQITSDGNGFLRGNPFTISLIEINSTTNITSGPNTYNVYNIGTSATVSINQVDEYTFIGAHIGKSTVGDYYEYYATYDNGFIEQFIFNANAIAGNKYIVLHEIIVFEQVGSATTQTAYVQSIQSADFNQPQQFRPVLKFSAQDVSFTLQYTMRLYNQADSSQIIRIATYSDYNPQAWGPNLSRIQLTTDTGPNVIYNKVVTNTTITNSAFIQNSQQINPYTNVYIPSFFDRSLITINNYTVLLDSSGKLTVNASASTQPVYGQGQAGIMVTPFDNYYKFTILKTEAQHHNVPTPLDLGGNAIFNMVFINDNGNKSRYRAVVDSLVGNPAQGDIVFMIPEADSVTILQYTQNLQFWISSTSPDGSETNIYQGQFFNVTQRAQLDALQAAAIANAANNLDQVAATLAPTTTTTAISLGKNLTAAPHPILTPMATVTAIAAPGTGHSVTISGVTIPVGTTSETIAHINAILPGLAVDIPTAMTSIVANILPKSLISVPKQTLGTQTKLVQGLTGRKV